MPPPLPLRVLPNIWRLGQVSDSKFGTNVSNEMLLNTAKNARVTTFTVSELLMENQQGGLNYTPPPPTHTHTQRLGLINERIIEYHYYYFQKSLFGSQNVLFITVLSILSY